MKQPVRTISYDETGQSNPGDFDDFEVEEKATVNTALSQSNGQLIIPNRELDESELGLTFENLIVESDKFRESWNRNRPDFNDQSASSFTWSLGLLLLLNGAKDQEIINVCETWRRKHKEKPHDANWYKSELERLKKAAAKDRSPRSELQTGQRGEVKPEVTLPGGSVTISETAGILGGLLSQKGDFYRRGDRLVQLSKDDDGEHFIKPVKTKSLPATLEKVARLTKIQKTKDSFVAVPAICSKSVAELIEGSDDFIEELPVLKLLSRCAVLSECNGELRQVTGYDPASCVYALGDPVPDVELTEAIAMIQDILADFNFATPSDRSRAIAALITPALVFSDLLGARAPIDLGEADKSQTGKGFRNKLIAAVYREIVRPVTQKKSGVGGLEESFNWLLIRGALFIALDNIRGRVDSPAIESFLTEDRYLARIPYSPDIEIDPKRIIVLFTSNRAEITRDLANRSSCVRILKQDEKYQFQQYPEGDILDHVRRNQPRYLGAVFSVVKEWYRQRKPRTDETAHDFRVWCQTLDWIVQNIFGAAPLMSGHKETKDRMTNPSLTWLRDVAIAVNEANITEQWLRAYEILDLLMRCSDLEIPGITPDDDLEDSYTRDTALKNIGRRLGRCFEDDTVEIDGFIIRRNQTCDLQGRSRNEYMFSKLSSSPPLPREGPEHITHITHITPSKSEILDSVGSLCGEVGITGKNVDSEELEF